MKLPEEYTVHELDMKAQNHIREVLSHLHHHLHNKHRACSMMIMSYANGPERKYGGFQSFIGLSNFFEHHGLTCSIRVIESKDMFYISKKDRTRHVLEVKAGLRPASIGISVTDNTGQIGHMEQFNKIHYHQAIFKLYKKGIECLEERLITALSQNVPLGIGRVLKHQRN